MNGTPRGSRLQIGIFGRVNSGKSSLLNLLAGQDAALTSATPGTTTDAVEKSMELLPLGPVLLFDTPGLSDTSNLGKARVDRALRVFDRVDVALLVVEPGIWGEAEESVITRCYDRKVPVVIVINKCDLRVPPPAFTEKLSIVAPRIVTVSCADTAKRDEQVRAIKEAIAQVVLPRGEQPPLIGDLVPRAGLVVLVCPIDAEAPKGRLILPQVQVIRAALDGYAIAVVARETELPQALAALSRKPDLVVCDSQVVREVVRVTPESVPCTTFSILFSRAKGDLVEQARGAARLGCLHRGDRVLIAEACTHHAVEDDIGRVKIPRWLEESVGGGVETVVKSGAFFPSAVSGFSAVIHCGGCMLTRKEMQGRIDTARGAGVAITNYGMAIAFFRGVLERVLRPFPEALAAYETERA